MEFFIIMVQQNLWLGKFFKNKHIETVFYSKKKCIMLDCLH